MINYINVELTVNCDAEIERAVEFLSRLCAEAYVGTTEPYNPSWCTVEVHLGDFGEEGPFEVGLAAVAVPRKYAPFLRGLVDHALGRADWDFDDLRDRAYAYECLERDDEEARMQEEFQRLVCGNDRSQSPRE